MGKRTQENIQKLKKDGQKNDALPTLEKELLFMLLYFPFSKVFGRSIGSFHEIIFFFSLVIAKKKIAYHKDYIRLSIASLSFYQIFNRIIIVPP